MGESSDHSAQAAQPYHKGAAQRPPWHHKDEGTSAKLLVVAWTGPESGKMRAGVPSLPSCSQRTCTSTAASLALANQAVGENPHRLCWPISRTNVPGHSGRTFQMAGSHTDEYNHVNQNNRGITSSVCSLWSSLTARIGQRSTIPR